MSLQHEVKVELEVRDDVVSRRGRVTLSDLLRALVDALRAYARRERLESELLWARIGPRARARITKASGLEPPHA